MVKLLFFNESWERKRETIALILMCTCTVLSGYFFWFLSFYLLFTTFWWLVPPIFLWIYLDRTTCDRGARPFFFIQNSIIWQLVINYFNSTTAFAPNCTFNPSKNYLFCCYPHGVLPGAPYANLVSTHGGFNKHFPGFRRYFVVLRHMLFAPITRELLMGMGVISPSEGSLRFVLGRPEGGNVVVIIPGGALEASLSKPGTYKVVLKNRKGCAKMALRTGASLVPVVTFGETDTYDQLEVRWLKGFQGFVRKWIGFTPVIPYGRGVFHDGFGLVPRRVKLSTMVGNPIDVERVREPSQEEIDELHRRFVKDIVCLFEDNKHKYLENAENINLELV